MANEDDTTKDALTEKEEPKAVAEIAKENEAPEKASPPQDSTATEGDSKETTKGEEKKDAPADPTAPKDSEGGTKDKEKKTSVHDVFLALEGDEAKEKSKILKAKGSKNVQSGIVHIKATFNNTIVTVTDLKGNTIGKSSAGKMNFRGSRKSTAYAAQVVSQDACRQAMGHGLKTVEIRIKGPGSGREAAARAVQAIGIDVTGIKDITPVPHNGCRPPKARRV